MFQMHHQGLEARIALLQRAILGYLRNKTHCLSPQGHTWVLYIFSRCLVSGDLKSGSQKVRGQGLRKLPSVGMHVPGQPCTCSQEAEGAAASDAWLLLTDGSVRYWLQCSSQIFLIIPREAPLYSWAASGEGMNLLRAQWSELS